MMMMMMMMMIHFLFVLKFHMHIQRTDASNQGYVSQGHAINAMMSILQTVTVIFFYFCEMAVVRHLGFIKRLKF